MFSYFKPPQRKVGVITLFLACISAAGWVRSRSTLDVAYITLPLCRCVLVSANQQFRLVFERDLPVNMIVQIQQGDHHVIESWVLDKGFQPFLFRSQTQIGKVVFSKANVHWIPYWSIVIPLTLLSCWLLLSRPRTKPGSPTS